MLGAPAKYNYEAPGRGKGGGGGRGRRGLSEAQERGLSETPGGLQLSSAGTDIILCFSSVCDIFALGFLTCLFSISNS